MFGSITTEILLLSLLPVIIIGIIDLIALLVLKKKYRNYRFNYFFELTTIFAIGLVLPLIVGYTIWIIKTFSERGIVSSNIWYVVLLIFLSLFLFVMLIILFCKTLKNAKEDEKIDKIVKKDPKIKIWEIDKEDQDEKD